MAKERAFANQKREMQLQRLQKLARGLLLATATLLTFATVGLLAADQLYRPDTFVISQLKIRGAFNRITTEQVREALVEEDLGNFFSVDLLAIKSVVEALPWVYRANVRREWPNTLELYVEEHKPVMRWGKDKWVSSVGQVIDLDDDIELGNAIVLNGRDADASRMLQAAFNWKQQLAKRALELKSVSLSSSQAWSLGVVYAPQQAQFEIQLGRDDIANRLARFEFLFDQKFRDGTRRLTHVDARYPDGLAVKFEPIETDLAMGADALAANH